MIGGHQRGEQPSLTVLAEYAVQLERIDADVKRREVLVANHKWAHRLITVLGSVGEVVFYGSCLGSVVRLSLGFLT